MDCWTGCLPTCKNHAFSTHSHSAPAPPHPARPPLHSFNQAQVPMPRLTGAADTILITSLKATTQRTQLVAENGSRAKSPIKTKLKKRNGERSLFHSILKRHLTYNQTEYLTQGLQVSKAPVGKTGDKNNLFGDVFLKNISNIQRVPPPKCFPRDAQQRLQEGEVYTSSHWLMPPFPFQAKPSFKKGEGQLVCLST